MADSLSPRVSRRKLPPRIARKRATQEERDTADQRRFEQAIAAHIRARWLALNTLADAQQAVADEFDLNLTGDTRPAAVWQMAGRCIGTARATLDLLDLGYTVEVLQLGRALHEAARLLAALAMPEEESLLSKWLAGEYVSPKEGREAEQRFERRLNAALTAEGRQPVEPTDHLTRKIHRMMSEAAHHQRPSVEGDVAPDLRKMVVGPDPTWNGRAAATSLLMSVVSEAIDAVGDALALFHGHKWKSENVTSYRTAFEALGQDQPLR